MLVNAVTLRTLYTGFSTAFQGGFAGVTPLYDRIALTVPSTKATDAYVGVVALSAPRTITLPAAADFPAGQPLYVADESGACSTDRPIIVAAAGGDTVAGQANITLASPYQKAVFHCDGTSLWTL